MENIDTFNIPAYQRKRSLAAKARKKPSYSILKKPPACTTRKRQPLAVKEVDLSENFPSQELFPSPLEEDMSVSKIGAREMKICGTCEGYFDKIQVAVVKITSPLRTGDIILFEKEGGLFEQEIASMQINRKDVSLARSGSDIGLKTIMEPTVGTVVYKVI